MALDTEDEALDMENEGGVPDNSADEPKTTTFDRESFVNDAFAEGIEESVIEDLAGKDTVTLDDLRKIPGSEGLTDEQLQASWDKAVKEAGGVDGTTPKVDLPFPVYDAAGNKINADKVTLEDLLSGKSLIGYQAMGKEQRKAFADVVRNASQGHWNEHRYNTVQGQYRESAQTVQKLQAEARQFEEQKSQWTQALTALTMGDNTPMRQLVEAYKTALGKSGIVPEGFVSQESARESQAATERGMQWWTDVGMPAAYDIAGRYNADAKEVQGAVKWFIENEPALTPQRIDEILRFDVPMLLEQNGYNASGTLRSRSSGNAPSVPNDDEMAGLKRQIEALTARLAGSTNDRTNTIRDKGKRIPPPGSGATGGAGDSMPSFKTRAEMKEYLQS